MGGLYTGEGWFEIFFVTGIIGGLAAWATGRAIAETWRPYYQLVAYMLLLGAAVRFVLESEFMTGETIRIDGGRHLR